MEFHWESKNRYTQDRYFQPHKSSFILLNSSEKGGLFWILNVHNLVIIYDCEKKSWPKVEMDLHSLLCQVLRKVTDRAIPLQFRLTNLSNQDCTRTI